MPEKFKPEGFNSVSPYLLVKDMMATLNFLKTVFNAQVIHQHTRNNQLVHVSIKIDDSVVMLGQVDSTEELSPCHVHIYVQNIDSVFNKALKAGAVKIQSPEKRDDGDIRGAVRDINGVVWWLGEKI